MPLQIETISVGPFDVNAYVIYDVSRQAMVVDPGLDADVIAEFLRRKNLAVRQYLVTHGHADHVCALGPLTRDFPAPFLMHAADKKWAFSERNQIPPYYPVPELPASAWAAAEERDYVEGPFHFRIAFTPGHSPGGICFIFKEDGFAVTGDTLFQGTVGRTDLPGGDGRLLTQSLRKLATLPPVTRIYPGHGPASTIADELRTNIFMRGS